MYEHDESISSNPVEQNIKSNISSLRSHGKYTVKGTSLPERSTFALAQKQLLKRMKFRIYPRPQRVIVDNKHCILM
jgi:hypothetical protein